jgi:hypothetical protein
VTAKTTSNAFYEERAWLGYAGLIPFLICLAMLLATDNPVRVDLVIDALRYYAAVIASFLGAIHWGVLIKDVDRRHARLRWGIIPSLGAWALLFLPAAPGLLGFAVLFAAILFVDLKILPLPDMKYQKLRLRLSVVVVMTLLAAALILPPFND